MFSYMFKIQIAEKCILSILDVDPGKALPSESGAVEGGIKKPLNSENFRIHWAVSSKRGREMYPSGS